MYIKIIDPKATYYVMLFFIYTAHKILKSQASYIYEKREIGRCGPRGPKQQRPRGSQPSCDMDADQL